MHMGKILWKDSIRDIRKTMISWFAIAIVTMLGCGVFCGVLFYAEALEEKGRALLAETNYEDLSIMAVTGLFPDEMKRIRETEGILDAEGGFFLPDSLLTYADKSEKTTICSIPKHISVPVVREGIMPSGNNECALTASAMSRRGLHLGDTVRLTAGGDSTPKGLLKAKEFRITAVIEHGEYLYTEYDSYIFVPLEAFDTRRTLGCYPYIRIDADIPEDVKILSDQYTGYLLPVKKKLTDRLEEIRPRSDPGVGRMAVLTRSIKEGFLTFKTDVHIIYRLATIFVLIFLLIGAIVIASTITIQINRNMKIMGTMKAFGFTGLQFLWKYLLYGNSAVVLGMVLSIALAAVLQQIIKFVIGDLFLVKTGFFAFYVVPYLALVGLEILIASVTAVSVTMHKILRISAVDLMSGNDRRNARSAGMAQDAGSAAGKRKGGAWLYSRLIFRNMKNDLPRIVTSVIIIAGSCLLMGLGITLKDSLDHMMVRSAAEIYHYDLEAELLSGHKESSMQNLIRYLEEKNVSYLRMQKKNCIYIWSDTEEYAAVFSGDESLFSEFIELTGTEGGERIIPAGSDLIADQKMFERLHLQAGDTITVRGDDLRKHSLTISHICRNYYPRALFLGPEAYRAIFGEDPADEEAGAGSAVLIRLSGTDKESFAGELAEQFPEFEISYTDRLPDAFEPMSRIFHVVVYILIGLSVIMAVFVLLNLVDIFVKRRKNELIIMAVNGFPYRKQIEYLLMEAIVTTLCGLILSVFAGWAMTDMVVRIIEMEELMLVRSFDLNAWIIAVSIETVFAAVIYMFAFRQLRQLDITELTR